MKEDRIFVRDGRRHHRRTYSTREVRAGAAVFVLLATVTVWVAWKGDHPDPALFVASAGFASAGATAASRGPLPADLAPPGWREGPIQSFDRDNLYVKIDGRADYYLGFGFERLWCVTLTGEADPGVLVDIELFDQGTSAGALGAYAGERSPDVRATLGAASLGHVDRNALFLARGRYYVRAIAPEESEAMRALLDELKRRLETGLPGEPLPWSYALFAGAMRLDPAGVSYLPENAFSLGFARDVHVARLDSGDTEVFVVAAPDSPGARGLAERFTQGLLEYGTEDGAEGGVTWIADRYLGTIAGVATSDRFVTGVRGAPDRKAARAALDRLSAALLALPAEVLARAVSPPAAGADAASTDLGYPGAEPPGAEPKTGGEVRP